MKKSRFLWIRDLPAKCRDTDLRSVLERHGSIQKIRLFKEGHMRHAVVTFVDIKSATAVINTENKINDTLLKVEYCDSADITGGIINHKSNNSTSHRNSEISNQIPASLSSQNNNTNLDHKTEKELNMKNTLHKGSNDSHHPLSNTDHLGRGPLIFKRTNSNPSNMSGVQMFNQVLRPVQSSALTARMSNSYRGLKISDLPPSSKLSDAYLRQSLFTEFRRCGRIQSIVLPPTNGPTNTTRLAIVTFRRAEEAECAYQAIQGGAKILFSTPVSVELHPGSNGNDELPVKRSSASNALFSGNAKLNDNLLPVNALPTTTTTTTQSVQNKTLNSHSTEDHTPNNNQTTLNKSPTRTLYVAGLTVGPTGPVTSEQLTTAFRKFGDIINVQLKSSSNSALIQFAEMRGPIRAMNAHAREPLRLGGRPLSLAYTPSTPTTCLWVSDLPPSLVSLSDEELLHTLSQIAPVQEIALINRNDQNTRAQSTPSISASSPHCAAYIKLNSTEHAIRLLTELRSGKQYSCSQQSSTSSSITTAGVNKTSTRRPIAVDFASPRQSSIVANLQLNVSRSSLNSHRVRIISSSNVDRWESSNKSINSLQPPPSASSAITTLTSKSIDSTTHSVTRSSVNIVKTSTYRTTTISQTSTPVTSGLSSSHNQLHLNNSLSDVVTDLKKNNHIFVDKQSDVPTKGSSIRRSSRSKSSINQSNILSDRVYHELSNNRLKRSHDTSPSSLSTSSSSSSTSTSSDSSSSSSSSSISSTSISSSGSSMSASSGATSHRRNKTSPTKSNHKLKSIDSYDNKHSIKTSEHTSSSQCNPIKIYKSSNNNNKVKEGACLKKTDSFHSSTVHSSRSGDSNSSWLTDAPSDSSFIQQPLRVMTMNSSVLSPIRSSAASSGGLSSPGGSSSSIIGNNSLRKTPNTGLENVSSGCQSEFVGPSPNHHSSLRLSTATQPLTHTPTALIMGEFRVSPTLRACSVSASSGVSSGGPSFSSTNSSGGGSTGSSPLTSNNSAMSNCQSIVVSKSNCGSQIKVTSSSPSLKRNIIHIGQSNGVDTSHTGSANKSRTFSDSTSSFKVHLSSNSALASSSPGSRSPSCMSSTTTPLTVSIKLAGITRPSQPSNLVSPCSLSENNDVFTANQDKQSNDSLPLTPVSAPPLGCKTSRHASTDPRRRSIGVEAPVGGGTNNDMTDWWSNGSPVYESMYDKIKRRTNKEAEERRQRQLEAFTSREKKNRKQRKKEQLTKSPPSNSVPISSPDSFSNEQCGKINAFSSNGKSHHSVSSRCKLEVNNRSSNKKHTNRQKSEISSTHSFLDDDNNHLSQWHSTHTHTRSDRVCTDASESHLYSRRMSRNMNSRTKRRRSVVSSLSSSLSSEGECNSNSPPETLTRLSLGMRFPVSATYHECIRPEKSTPNNRKWSNLSDDDDDGLSQLSSSLSCSSTESKPNLSNSTKRKSHFPVHKLDQSKNINYSSFNSSPFNRNWDTDIRSSELRKKCTSEWKNFEKKSKSHNKQTSRACKRSKPFLTPEDRYKSSEKTSYNNGMLKRQHNNESFSSKSTSDLHPNKRKKIINNTSYKINNNNNGNDISNKNFNCTHRNRRITSPKHSTFRNHHIHSPKPYFSDDGTILDSEIDDVKGSFISGSDSISHTTGTSEHHSIKDTYLHKNDRPLSSPLHSETDESTAFGDLDSHIHSPNSSRCHSDCTRKQRKCLRNPCIMTTTTTATTLQSRDDGDSVFDALLDSDRFSANSKSTISTEPMEQCELDEDDDEDANSPCLKFTTDGEDDDDVGDGWHSGIPSSSPHPVHLEFDDDDDDEDCGLSDSKPKPNTVVTYQSDSPVEKLSNSILESSDDEKPREKIMIQSTSIVKNQHCLSSSYNDDDDDKKVDSSFEASHYDNGDSSLVLHSSPNLVNKLSPTDDKQHSDQHILTEQESDRQTLSPVLVEQSSTTPTIISELKLDKPEHCPSPLKPVVDEVAANTIIPPPSTNHENVAVVTDHSSIVKESDLCQSSTVITAVSHSSVCTSLSNSVKVKGSTSIHSELELVNNQCATGEVTTKSSPKNDTIQCIPCVSNSPILTQLTSSTSSDSVPVSTTLSVFSKPLNSPLTVSNKPVNVRAVDKSIENPIQLDHSVTRQACLGNVKSVTSMSSSVSLNSQPTEVHDITRYVQSVIERVKAERVEENQQAAAAAAHCHHSNHHSTLPATSIPISTYPSVSVNQTLKVCSEQNMLPGIASSHNKRSYSGQRRSLLVTASTCSPAKNNSSSRCTKLINPSTHNPNNPITCSIDEPTTHIINSTASCTIASSHPIISSDLQLPSIPGVNACTPLNLPVSQPNTTQRVTRQSCNALDNSQISSKRSDTCSNNLDTSTSLPVGVTSRRQRRSETKTAPNTNTTSVSKDNPVSFITSTTSISIVSPSSISTCSTSSNLVIGKSTEVSMSNHPVISTSCVQVSSQSGILSSSDCIQKVKRSNFCTSVDPYEPNFDEESPVGFNPAQLHPHRLSPSLCPSPNSIHHHHHNQPRKTPTTTISNTTNSQSLPITSLAVISSSLSVNSSSSSSSGLIMLDSKPIRNVEMVTCTTGSQCERDTPVVNMPPTFCVSSGQLVDTVDEVISDVCAGHFDVQSYLKNWCFTTTTTTTTPTTAVTITGTTSNNLNIVQQSKVTMNNNALQESLTVPNSSLLNTSTCTTTTITTTANLPLQSNNATIVANISNTPSGIPFSLPITSEPIVAAVTIPTGKSNNLGKNDSNNTVNIGTGSAVLNTLLAALQLIPGSQVTVTGPAAAAGVVGNLTANNSRTISAATITLPVNAAQQAAANIKAAVLSVTNANSQGKATNLNWNQQDSSTPSKNPNEFVKEVSATRRVFTPPISIPSTIPPNTHSRLTTSLQQSNTTPVVSTTSVQIPFIAHDNITSGSINTVTHQYPRTLQSGGTTMNESVVSNTTSAPPLYQLQMAMESSSARSHLISVNACEQPLNTTPVFTSGGKYSNVNSAPSLHASLVSHSQQVNICTTKQSFIPPTSPTVTNGAHPQIMSRHVSNAPPPSSSPVIHGRNPSSIPSLTNPVLQTLIDRLGGNVEPSVAMALFQAALNGPSLRRNPNDNSPDTQVNPYLRHVAQQLLDNRGCNGSTKPSIPISHSESQIHSANICTKSLSPSLTMQHTPANNTSYTANPLRPTAPGHPFVSSVRINPIDVEMSSADLGINTLISPPVVTSRFPVSDPQTVNNNNNSNNTIPASNMQSWNNLGSSYPLVWQGRLSLKNMETRVALHFVQGNHNLLNACMTLLASGGGGQPQFSLITSGGPLRIVQRMRLEPAQLEGVQRKLNQEGASCACLALPAGSNPVELAQQTQILNENFIRYMQEKMAAGIINVGHPDYQQGLYVVHIFPPCEFSHTQLSLAAPDLHRCVMQANQSHLLVVITTV